MADGSPKNSEVSPSQTVDDGIALPQKLEAGKGQEGDQAKRMASDRMREEANARPPEVLDSERDAVLKYDEQCRLVQVSQRNGNKLSIRYAADGPNPVGFERRNASGKTLASGKQTDSEQFSLNQQNGTIDLKRPICADDKSHPGASESQLTLSADGRMVTRFNDDRGNPRYEEKVDWSDKAPVEPKRSIFVYFDHDGKATSQATLIDGQRPILKVTEEASGKGAERLVYHSANELKENKPYARESIALSSNEKNHTVTQTDQRCDLTDPDNPRKIGESTKTVNTTNGEVTITSTNADTGINEAMKFDANGKMLSYNRKEGEQQFDFQYKGGKLTGVLHNGNVLSGDRMETARQLADTLEAKARSEYSIALRPTMDEQIGPTQGRVGHSGNGILVWQDGEKLVQRQVENGIIKDGGGKNIGTFTDDGTVKVDGKTFQVQATDRAAFHGTGSDKTRLDLVAIVQENGITGHLTSPDGKESYTVVAGNLYDVQGKFYAKMDKDFNLVYPELNYVDRTHRPTPASSRFNGWKLEGFEDGRARLARFGAEAVSGKIFLPEPDGAKDAKPKEYNVRLGMLIDKATGEQIGWLQPPTEGSDGHLSGGMIVRETPQGTTHRTLDSHAGAIFDLKPTDTTLQLANLRGICKGASEYMADGGTKPGVGGIANIQALSAEQATSVSDAGSAMNDASNSNYLARYFLERTAQKTLDAAKQNSQMVSGVLDAALKTGELKGMTVADLERIDKETRERSIPNPLSKMRIDLDQAQQTLQDLPKDTRQISGMVQLPFKDAGGAEKARTIQIREGKLYGEDGKSQVGSIDSATGEMRVIDSAGNKVVKTHMSDLQGAAWHLHFKGEDGSAKSVDWFSLGAGRGIADAKFLQDQAAKEADYARTMTVGQQHLHMTAMQNDYDGRLAAIVKDGIRTAEDLKFIAQGPRAVFRPQNEQNVHIKDGQGGKPIELPSLTDANAKTANGHLRMGAEVYAIHNGQLYKTHTVGGQETIEKEASGKLKAGYVVETNGRGNLALAEQERVLMEFTLAGSAEKQRIIGLGKERRASDGANGWSQGGLLNVSEFKRRADATVEECKKQSDDYFKNKPYLTGWIVSQLASASEQILKNMPGEVARGNATYNHEIEKLFVTGFDTNKLDNNQIDNGVQLSRGYLRGLGYSTVAATGMSGAMQDLQKTTNEAIVMAAITVGTAGLGAYVGAAADVAEMSTVARGAVQVGAGSLLGGTISAAGRASDSSNGLRNFGAGMFEGGAMAFGSAAAGSLGELSQLKKLRNLAALTEGGTELSGQQSALMRTVLGKMVSRQASDGTITATYLAAKGADSFVQSGMFMLGSGVRTGDYSHIDAKAMAMGTAWMMVAHGAGSATGKGTGMIGGVAENGLAKKIATDSVNAYTNAGLNAYSQGWESERQRIADELGMDVKQVNNDVMRRHGINYGNIISKMNEEGVIAALSAPILTASLHGVQHLAQRGTSANKTEPKQQEEGSTGAVIAGAIGSSFETPQPSQSNTPVGGLSTVGTTHTEGLSSSQQQLQLTGDSAAAQSRTSISASGAPTDGQSSQQGQKSAGSDGAVVASAVKNQAAPEALNAPDASPESSDAPQQQKRDAGKPTRIGPDEEQMKKLGFPDADAVIEPALSAAATDNQRRDIEKEPARRPVIKPTIVNGQLNMDGLCLVHASNYEPVANADGSVDIKSAYAATEGQKTRSTVHFAVNHRVEAHGDGSWDSAPFVVITPFREMVKQNESPAAFLLEDTFWTTESNQPLRVPKATVVGPGSENMTGLLSIDGNRVAYKTAHFSPEEEMQLVAYARDKCHETLVETGNLSERQKSLAEFSKRYAIDAAIEHAGFAVEPSQSTGWTRNDYTSDMGQRFADSLGTLSTRHSATGYRLVDDKMKNVLAAAEYYDVLAGKSANQMKVDSDGRVTIESPSGVLVAQGSVSEFERVADNVVAHGFARDTEREANDLQARRGGSGPPKIDANTHSVLSDFEERMAKRIELARKKIPENSEAARIPAATPTGDWEMFMRTAKHQQGHATNCGQMAVMHDLAARTDLETIMQQAIVREGDGTFRARFYNPKDDQPVWITVTAKEITEPQGYVLKSNNKRIAILRMEGQSYIAENPDAPGQTITYSRAEIGIFHGMKQPRGRLTEVTDQQILERAYSRFLQEYEPTRYQKIPGGASMELSYRRQVDDYRALNNVKSWDFAGDLTGVRDFKTVLTGQLDSDKLAALSTQLKDHALVYEPEAEHDKLVTTGDVATPHAHKFHDGHTYAVLDINPNKKTITVLSSLMGEEPLTISLQEFLANDEDGAINIIKVVRE